MTIATIHAEVDRAAGRPLGVCTHHDHGDTTYRLEVIEAEVVKPRRIRAFLLRDDTKHDIEVIGFMLPFLALFVGDFSCLPLWAALPGCAVITMSMFITIIVLACHSKPPSGPTPGKRR